MILKTYDLTKCYGNFTAVDRLNLAVEEAEIYAFLGPNGAGKTTTIRIINGLTDITSGRVEIAGADIGEKPLAVKGLCGLAAQNVNLDGELTVGQNLDFHGRLYGMDRRSRRERTDELLAYVELAERRDSLVKTLSGGMKRRLMLARALLHRPRLLFLDEPTSGLDPVVRRRLWNLIRKVRQDGTAVFLTTHYIEEAEFLADRVGFINQGRMVAEGRPEELMRRLGEWAVDRVGETDMETSYWPDREAAGNYMDRVGDACVVRRVNLEDAFIEITGERVNANGGGRE